MKKLLIGALFLMAGNAYATGPVGTLGTADSVTIGGRVVVTRGLKALFCEVSAGNTYCSPVAAFATSTAGYTATGGGFKIKALKVNKTSTGSGLISVGHGTSSVGQDSVAAPTAPTYAAGTASGTAFRSGSCGSMTAVLGVQYFDCGDIIIPSGKLPFVAAGGGDAMAFTMYGEEL